MKTFSIKEKSLVAKLAAWKIGGQRVAIVIGRKIHLHGVSKEKFLTNERWLRHELKHVQQFERYGFFTFISKYLWHSIFEGYHHCRYEVEAREAEDDDTLIAQYSLSGKEGWV